MLPVSEFPIPAMILRRVDFPAPLEPTSPMRSWGPITIETALNSFLPPNWIDTRSRESMGEEAGGFGLRRPAGDVKSPGGTIAQGRKRNPIIGWMPRLESFASPSWL